ncbi:MAG: hypothetical protein NT056_09985 [Proteobacteria bacterium]|nr:hypothetical protein [Pseudomonadota bacterium]
MKKGMILILGLAGICLAACASDISQKYAFSLVEPAISESTAMQDETLRIIITPGVYEIGLLIDNLVWEPVFINWNDARYIDPDGKTQRLIHRGIKLQDKEVPQASGKIRPRESLDELIIPFDKIKQSMEGWYIEHLFDGYENRTPGFEFGIVLPVQTKAGKSEYHLKVKATRK